ncbi:MAG: S26 family signal peptidase [Alphaproteobacteria bacterium]
MRGSPIFCASVFGLALAIIAAADLHAPDQVIYNHSPSLPRGFYVRTSEAVTMGSIVTVRAVDVTPAYASLRHFTGARDRFLKRVAAAQGDRVCAIADSIEINGNKVGRRVPRDRQRRALPHWSGCFTLTTHQVFLMGDTSDSFDGRYWGVTDLRVIEGVWRPL